MTGNCPTLFVGQFAHLKICPFLHIRSFQKRDCAIKLLFAHLKKANVRLHFLVALLKSEVTLFDRSFQKCDCVIALFKCATK